MERVGVFGPKSQERCDFVNPLSPRPPLITKQTLRISHLIEYANIILVDVSPVVVLRSQPFVVRSRVQVVRFRACYGEVREFWRG